ncbi:ATP-binding cassette domain-containing protein [Microbacterium sp. JZ31]|uniref:ATP-binding cassette domain-containing protein n=1 Tax=Microbacterium sp. JZ31 TaxID=1906274 RepID=UPI001EE45CC5|nr:ATP-binding cassette domain-containing protein [Microbacterium sp. JZ31]
MTDGKVLEFRGVTKIFGDVAAVSDFTARVEPGVVTGFVGPNGAGKSTTLRILLGDIAPTQGTALIGGVPYKRLSQPRREVGALLENQQYRPRRTAERHLIATARAIGVPASRVTEVLEVVGLGAVGGMRIGGFSLGMRQRLGVAEALLGDPGVLIFDEPANGLDPEGIRWMRMLMRRLADEGRTVLMSSHVLSEVQQVADNILIISNGRLLFSGGIEQLADIDAVVAVDSPDRAALRDALRARGIEFELRRSGINVTGVTTAEIGALAAEAGVPLSSLTLKQQSLEDVFLKVVSGTWEGPASEAAAAEPDVAGGTADNAPDVAGETADDAPSEAEASGSEPTPTDAPAEGQPEEASQAQADYTPTQADVAVDRAEASPDAEADQPGAGEAQAETVDELPFAPTTVDAVVVDRQTLSEQPKTPAPSYGDPLAFLTRPLSEIEKDVVAAETELIAASPEGEQPTPGWVPAPEYIPSPREEDADDPDRLEAPDSVVDLPDGDDRTDVAADGLPGSAALTEQLHSSDDGVSSTAGFAAVGVGVAASPEAEDASDDDAAGGEAPDADSAEPEHEADASAEGEAPGHDGEHHEQHEQYEGEHHEHHEHSPDEHRG